MTDRRCRAEAAAWLARLQSDAPSPQDRAACEAWLAEAQSHRQALAEATAAWEAVGGLSVEPRPPRTREARGARGAMHRRAVLASLVGTGCLAAAWAGAAPRSYATGVGETKRLHLDDGSRLILDACSEVKTSFGSGPRKLDLVYGRIAVEIAADLQQPFVVTRNSGRVLGFGRALDVACLQDGLAVTAVDGLVLVQPPGHEMVRLDAGERLQWSTAAGAVTDRPMLDAITAWQDGRLVFANEPLSEAVTQMNRYTPIPIALQDRAIGNLRISGTYRTHSAEAFARSAAMLYGLDVVSGRGRLLLRRAPSA